MSLLHLKKVLAELTIILTVLLNYFGGQSIGAPVIVENPLQLKTTKENILYSQTYDKVKYDANGKRILGDLLIAYAYKSGELAPALDNEIIEERTPHIVYRNLGGNKRSAESGHNFYKENGVWKQIKFGTTTKESFDLQTITFWDRFWDRFIALAADTGTTSPGTIANDDAVGSWTWTNPSNATSSDNIYADADGSATDITQYLKATNFGFSVPAGSTINGILAEIEKYGRASNSSSDNSVKIAQGGTIGGNELKAAGNWPTADAYTSYGGSTNLWGLSWTSTDINATGFGVGISGVVNNAGAGSEFWVDHISITVYYTVGVAAKPTPNPTIIIMEEE